MKISEKVKQKIMQTTNKPLPREKTAAWYEMINNLQSTHPELYKEIIASYSYGGDPHEKGRVQAERRANLRALIRALFMRPDGVSGKRWILSKAKLGSSLGVIVIISMVFMLRSLANEPATDVLEPINPEAIPVVLRSADSIVLGEETGEPPGSEDLFGEDIFLVQQDDGSFTNVRPTSDPFSVQATELSADDSFARQDDQTESAELVAEPAMTEEQLLTISQEELLTPSEAEILAALLAPAEDVETQLPVIEEVQAGEADAFAITPPRLNETPGEAVDVFASSQNTGESSSFTSNPNRSLMLARGDQRANPNISVASSQQPESQSLSLVEYQGQTGDAALALFTRSVAEANASITVASSPLSRQGQSASQPRTTVHAPSQVQGSVILAQQNPQAGSVLLTSTESQQGGSLMIGSPINGADSNGAANSLRIGGSELGSFSSLAEQAPSTGSVLIGQGATQSGLSVATSASVPRGVAEEAFVVVTDSEGIEAAPPAAPVTTPPGQAVISEGDDDPQSFPVGGVFEAELVVGVLTAGTAVPVIAKSVEGYIFSGSAALNPAGRLALVFERVINGSEVTMINALAIADDGYAGLIARSETTTENLAANLIDGTLQGVSDYAESFANNVNTSVTRAGITLLESVEIPLEAALGGALASAIKPDNPAQGIVRVYALPTGSKFRILILDSQG